MSQPFLQIDGLQAVFETARGDSHALRGVSFEVERGQIFGVVGESGCGKSMTTRAILGIMPGASRITGGQILFEGEDLLAAGPKRRQTLHRRIKMIFQNPKQALNPVFTVGQQLIDVMKYHNIASGKVALRQRAFELLADVGLPPADRLLNAYPHQLSGGQQQRVMIAMALSTEPDLLIADEPTTALDVTIQSQILALLRKLRDQRGLTIMLITHNMGVVAETCQDMAVLYAGRVVERGRVRDIFYRPQHPYTQGLLNTLPHAGSQSRDLSTIPGAVPDGLAALPGCAFAARCPYAKETCSREQPPWTTFEPQHWTACFLYSRPVTEVSA